MPLNCTETTTPDSNERDEAWWYGIKTIRIETKRAICEWMEICV